MVKVTASIEGGEATGIREPYTFLARDEPQVSLFVDAQGRRQGITFDE